MEESLIRVIALFAAIIPPVIIAIYFLIAARVNLNHEVMWTGFGFGAATAFPAVVGAMFYEQFVGYNSNAILGGIQEAFLGAAVPEEIFKFVAIASLCGWRFREFPPNQLFVLCILTSCGFACLENIFYIVEGDTWAATAIARSISAVPGHAFVGAVMGYCLYRATKSSVWFLWGVMAIGLPVLLHGTYDLPLFVLSKANGELTEFTQSYADFLILFFILVVIVEGIAAHLCLRAVLKVTANIEPNLVNLNTPSKAMPPSVPAWYQSVCESSYFWTGVGIICFSLAVILFLGSVWEADLGGMKAKGLMVQGFIAIALLHSVAFASLAIVLRRRNLIALAR